MPETAQFLLCPLNYLLFSSCIEGLSSGDQNKRKQNCPLVKPDFSLCMLFVMLWPHQICTVIGVCSQEIPSCFWFSFPAAGKAGLSSRADYLGEILGAFTKHPYR